MGEKVSARVKVVADIVYSPDDGGYYAELFDYEHGRTMATLPADGVFGSRSEACDAVKEWQAELRYEVEVLEEGKS